MDGIVIGMPPKDATGRFNHCHGSETHMWRKPSERVSPSFAGADKYSKQHSITAAVPLWAGLSAGGVAAVTFHKKKKLSDVEWSSAVREGKLRMAIRSLQPVKPNGPWHILCDNEAFLRAPKSREAHRDTGMVLWKLPPRSPDLNPIEKYWSWLRKQLRRRDLADLVLKRPALTKAGYTKRVKSVLRSRVSQRVAKNCAIGLKRVCQEVIAKKGAATSA